MVLGVGANFTSEYGITPLAGLGCLKVRHQRDPRSIANLGMHKYSGRKGDH